MLSAAEIAVIQAELTALLPVTATRTRHTATSDGAGGTRFTTTTTTYKCRIAPISIVANLLLQGGRETSVRQWQITLPHDADIQAGDTLTAGGVSYTVKSFMQDRSYNLCIKVMCDEVTS